MPLYCGPASNLPSTPLSVFTTREYDCANCNSTASVENPIRIWRMSRDTYIILCAHCYEAGPRECINCHTLIWHSHNTRVSICAACASQAVNCESCARPILSLSGTDLRPFSAICADCITILPTRCLHCHRTYRVLPNNPDRTCTVCGHTPSPPSTTNINKFARLAGVELECIATELPSSISFAQIGSDGSVSRSNFDDMEGVDVDIAESINYRSYEIRLGPVGGDILHSHLDYVCAKLACYKAYANRTCGTHVHIDARDYNPTQIENILEWWLIHEYMFFRMVRQARIKNRYCAPVNSMPRESWMRDRYRALNLTSLSEHGTFEFRLHHGTVNPIRLKKWIAVLMHFVERYADEKPTPQYKSLAMNRSKRENFADFCKQTELPLSLRKFVFDSARTYWTRRCGLFRTSEAKSPIQSPQPYVRGPLRGLSAEQWHSEVAAALGMSGPGPSNTYRSQFQIRGTPS